MRLASLPSPALAALLIVPLLTRPAQAEPPLASAPLAATPPPPPEDETRALRFTGGVSLTTLGLLVAATGGVLAGRAAISKRDIGNHCNAANVCDLIGYSLASEAVDFSTTATGMIPAGLVLAGAGVGLILSTTLKKSRATAWIAPTPGGVVVTGRW